MEAPESAIDVKMYEFGRLIDDVEESWCDCEMRNHDERSVAKYKQARDRLMGAIRGVGGACLEPPSTVHCSWCGGDLLNRNQAASTLPSQQGNAP